MRPICFASLFALAGCPGPEELEPRREAVETNDRALHDLERRARRIQEAVEQVQGGRTEADPMPDAAPIRIAQGKPLVPPQRVDAGATNHVLTVTRTGEASSLPPAQSPIRGESPCGWYIEMPSLRFGSDLLLHRSQLGRASPYRLLENGTPLRAHATPAAANERCEGAFRHAGSRFEFSPMGYAEAASERTYTVEYDSRVGTPRADGRALYWIYPGTELTFDIEGRWPMDHDPAQLVLAVKRVGAYKSRASYQLNWDTPRWLKGATPVVRHPIPPDTERITLSINSPTDGPLVVIDTLLIGNSDAAFVISAEGEGTLLGGEQ